MVRGDWREENSFSAFTQPHCFCTQEQVSFRRRLRHETLRLESNLDASKASQGLCCKQRVVKALVTDKTLRQIKAERLNRTRTTNQGPVALCLPRDSMYYIIALFFVALEGTSDGRTTQCYSKSPP